MTMIDLSAMDPPDLVETLDFEATYQLKLAHFKSIYPDWTAALESDPVVKVLELAAYDEVRYRARVNDCGRAVPRAGAASVEPCAPAARSSARWRRTPERSRWRGRS